MYGTVDLKSVDEFQFTHPGGVRPNKMPIERLSYNQVSIHAPGRGATPY